MKSSKPLKSRAGSRVDCPKVLNVEHSSSAPEIKTQQDTDKQEPLEPPTTNKTVVSASETILSAHKEAPTIDRFDTVTSPHSGDMSMPSPRRIKPSIVARQANFMEGQRSQSLNRPDKCPKHAAKKQGTSPELISEDSLTRQIREIHNDTRKSARIIRDSRSRLLEIQKKPVLADTDIRELGERNELLLREMERFDKLTRSIQRLVGAGVKCTGIETGRRESRYKDDLPNNDTTYREPGNTYEPAMYHEMKMAHPTVMLAERPGAPLPHNMRSKSELDLTRKLSECYDMQEKLVADNADLEVKRYILYKELMTKDQNLETCRAQVKRLQGELKFMNKENAALLQKLNRNHPEGDSSDLKQCSCTQESDSNKSVDAAKAEELVEKLEQYKSYISELEKQLGGLEIEIRSVREEMDKAKKETSTPCRAPPGQGHYATHKCYEPPPGGPPVPPNTRACGVCPPCPASCNPNAPPTPAERDVVRLTLQLKQTEESFKQKITECAMLRTDYQRRKEELEQERCAHREVKEKLRDLEMRYEGLTMQTNMLLGTKEQMFEQEVNVRALKQCYREAREEIDELRAMVKEQGEQVQDYRVKYLQAQQTVEEQRRQMDLMDMDNTRISEQINLEIQKVKIKFQEKLQELAPIPDLLKATQMRLKDAQQSQAIAEHNAEQLARELNSAREKVHMLLHNSVKPPEKPATVTDDKAMAMAQQRIAQLTENNQALKAEIERLKANVIRMEEAVLANEKRLQEKMNECAALGGELDRARDDAARALQRANDRTETIRKCMQTTVADLERQLASCRAQIKTGEKEREEIQARMKCQIKRLNENFEQAQNRILGLQTQVQTLRRATASDQECEDDGAGEPQDECGCRTLFDAR